MKEFIWTECLGCPLIGTVAINSFIKFHDNLELNVFAYCEDLEHLPKNKRIIYHVFPKQSLIKSYINRILNKFKQTYNIDESCI